MRGNCYLTLPPRLPQAVRVVLLILWGVIFAGAHSLTLSLYLVPLLALITFLLLPPFPLIVGAIFLSAYLDALPTASLPEALKLLLIGATGLAALVVLSVQALRRFRAARVLTEDQRLVHEPELSLPDAPPGMVPLSTPVSPSGMDPLNTPDASSGQQSLSTPTSSATLSPHFRHDVRTPLNLILAFCEALLNPASANREPLPTPIREDVEAIYRNAQQIKPLIEKLLENTASQVASNLAESRAARPRRTVILLDEEGAAFELFSQYVPAYTVIRAASVEAIGRLQHDSDLLAVAVNSDDTALIPVIAQLVGMTIPILMFHLTSAQPSEQFPGVSDTLMKPVEFEALRAALERTGAPLHTLLIVDDNHDNMQMLSRMLNSMPEPPHLLKAYSGREALALLNEETPNVILLDFVLPDMDGRVLLDYLRTDSRLARIPVLLVSAHRLPDILPLAGVTKLTLFRLAGFSPIHFAQQIDGLLSAFDSVS